LPICKQLKERFYKSSSGFDQNYYQILSSERKGFITTTRQLSTSRLHLRGMKKLALLGCWLTVGTARGQVPATPLPDSVATYLSSSLHLFETYALNRKSVDWPHLRQQVYQQAQGARTINDLLPLYPPLFAQLHDDHGWLTYQGKTVRWRNPDRVPYANTTVKTALAQKPGLLVTLLPHRIGYIRLPGINAGGSLAQQQAAAIVVRDSVARLFPHRVRAWILDLRLNDGGAMAPMLAGIAPLLGDGHLGGFVDYAGHAQEQWTLKEGNFYLDTLAITTLPTPRHHVQTNRPIAILLSGLTASSGEIVAISLRGRPATRFFGEPTYGATTANTSYPIQGSSYLTLAGSVDADRTGRVYPLRVEPDELILGGDNFTELQRDIKIQAALTWLQTAQVPRTRATRHKR
jgi:carboxyl-terminal processing protease